MTPAYPLPLVDDPRFDGGLILDLAKVIEAHGFPPVTDGTDLAGLQQSAFEFIFSHGRWWTTRGTPPRTPRSPWT